MPKIKVPRRDISLDMTAMCDMAFLLLTFFMLATKFTPEQQAVVDLPSSHAEVKLQEFDMVTIAIQKDGAIFFSVDGQSTRKMMIERMSEKYNMKFTNSEIKEFENLEEIGLPFNQLKSVLNMSHDDRKRIKYVGVPVDSSNNELTDWIRFARSSERPLRFAIKGDKDANYPVIEAIIATFQKQNINKFNLITTLEQ